MTSRPPKSADLVGDILRPRGFRESDPRALDAHLRRLLGLEPAVALRLGEVLGPLYRGNGFTALGPARFAEYAREDLGLEDRTARNPVRLSELLSARPALRASYLDGRVPMGHALLLTALPAGVGHKGFRAIFELRSDRDLSAFKEPETLPDPRRGVPATTRGFTARVGPARPRTSCSCAP